MVNLRQRSTQAFASSLVFSAVMYFEVGLDSPYVASWIVGLAWIAIALVTLYLGFSSMLRHERGRSIAISAIVLVLAIIVLVLGRDFGPYPHVSLMKPNQALQPTRMLVTFCAYAQPAPSTRVADL